MNDWRSQLKYDPVPPLLTAKDAELEYFVRRDLLDDDPGPVEQLWEQPGARKILKKQRSDGSWPRPGKPSQAPTNDGLIETWRQLRYLVEQFGLNRQHPQLDRAAQFVFTCQTVAGDFRGFIGNQYATYYTGALLALLVKAGYLDETSVKKAFQWLLEIRQDDGGWTIPVLSQKYDWQTVIRLTSTPVEPLEPDRSQPFSHNCTGMILRAFAAHPEFKHIPEAQRAAELLATRFFQKDAYTSYHSADYWLRFDYPFWWNNLVAALDSLAEIGLNRENQSIQRALDWLIEHQEISGLWGLEVARANRSEKTSPRVWEKKLWVGLAICRNLRHYFS